MSAHLREWPRWIAALLAAIWALLAPPSVAQNVGDVLVIDVNGAIGIATTRQITQAIAQAEERKAAALVVRLDTPGGFVNATREIIKAIVAAPVPVIVYVAPSGARAASAGTFIVYASHLAAMAPGTNIGAATPVNIGGLPGLPGQPSKEKESSKESSASDQKAINDTVAMLRSLAQLRGRSIDFAEKAVREAATLTAVEAKRDNVVEIVPGSIGDLLAQADGRKVKLAGQEVTLSLKDARRIRIEPDLRTRALAAIADPNVAFILLMIGFYGLLLEFWTPGTFVPGVIGGISLIVALTALSALPVNYGALALLVLGIALMIGEAFTPGLGILGIGGLIAFFAGAFYLFEAAGADFDVAVSLPLIIGTGAATALLLFAIVGAAIKARRRPAATGSEQMIGMRATVVSWEGGRGQVHVHGEMWDARAEKPLQPDESVRVVAREGLTLLVEP